MRSTPRSLLLALLVTALAVPTAGAATSAGSSMGATAAPASSARMDSLELGVVAEINAVRRRRGLAPVRASASLAAAADAHTQSMARAGFFSHTSADGTAFWKRVERFYAPAGFSRWSVGENLLWASPSVDPAGAVRMWLDSPAHRRTMLMAGWREVGLAAVHAAAALGVYGGRPVTIVTADFGVRR